MLRISFITLFAALAAAELGQRSLITARAVLPPRDLFPRQNQFTCAQATDTVCPDGSGCCPTGAACFVSDGVGLCSLACSAAQPTCVFNGVTACCPMGDSCGGSLCIPAGMNTGMPAMSSMSSKPSMSAAPSMSSAAMMPSSVAKNNATVAMSVTSKTTTAAPLGSTANFNLGNSTSSKPAMATIAAAPSLNAWKPLANLVGVVAIGLAI